MELQKCPYSTLAKQVGLTGPTVKKYIDVYKFMVDNNDTVQSHWNYYEQYVTSNGVPEKHLKAVTTNESFDN